MDMKKNEIRNVEKLLVSKAETIKTTMRIIDAGAVKTALVVDEKKRLCGVITDGDIRRGILQGVSIDENVTKIMNANPVFEYEHSFSKERILEEIKKRGLTGVPLLDKNNVVKEFVMASEGANPHHFNTHPLISKHLKCILVIGGAGYIGSILTRKLLKKGYKVNVLDMLLYGEDSLRECLVDPGLKLIRGDTRHIEDITEAMRGVDAVVHLAELVGDPACALKPITTQEINYFATETIASVCKHFQINRLVYVSSCSVYGASRKNELLTEEAELNPVSLYAKMKMASEKALMEMKDSNFLPTILRLGTVFGFSHRPRFDLVVNVLTARALKEGEITIMGGKQWRPNVYVRDVADTIISVLEAPLEKVGGEIFNVGSSHNNHMIAEIGEMVQEAVPTARMIVNSQSDDLRDYRINFDKLRNVLNIELDKSVKFGIEEVKAALTTCPGIDYKEKKYSNIKVWKEMNMMNQEEACFKE
ncbi:MAG: NAD-dependent epimerase/dehydratase family protein [Candidatus Omnitrophica bacterium]|nr:NAD-dependent epimerase/dehydratase family protein [Candidatus Omnitrophota bacterium]